MKYWCATCQSGEHDDIVGEAKDTDMCQLSFNHTSDQGCSIKDCLDNFFSSMVRNVSFRTDRYFHQCPHPQPRQHHQLLDIFGTKNKALIIQLNPRFNSGHGLCEVTEPDLAIASLDINLSECFSAQQNKTNKSSVIARLTGYITRTACPDSVKGVKCGHFASVTNNHHTCDFYLSDDLHPPIHMRLGIEPAGNWPKPYIMFHEVSSSCLSEWDDVYVPDNINWRQNEAPELYYDDSKKMEFSKEKMKHVTIGRGDFQHEPSKSKKSDLSKRTQGRRDSQHEPVKRKNRDPMKPNGTVSVSLYYSHANKTWANNDNTGLKHRDVSRLLAGEYKGMLNDEREQWVEKEKKGKVAIRS